MKKITFLFIALLMSCTLAQAHLGFLIHLMEMTQTSILVQLMSLAFCKSFHQMV